MARVDEQGGAVEAVPYMKAALVESHRERIARIEAGEQVLVGVNRYQETEPSPLTADADGGILVVDPAVEAEAQRRRWRRGARRATRRPCWTALEELRRVAASDENIMPATLAAARAGVTTGEWAARCATPSAPTARRPASARPPPRAPGEEIAELRDEVARV